MESEKSTKRNNPNSSVESREEVGLEGASLPSIFFLSFFYFFFSFSQSYPTRGPGVGLSEIIFFNSFYGGHNLCNSVDMTITPRPIYSALDTESSGMES